MDTYQIEAAMSPHDTKIMRNGEPLNNVQRFTVMQGVDEHCRLILDLAPDMVEVHAEGVDVTRNDRPFPKRFYRPLGYDPYNSDQPRHMECAEQDVTVQLKR